MKTTFDIPDSVFRKFKAKSHCRRIPAWAGVAEKLIRRYPEDPLDAEAMRDAIVAARRKGLS